MVQNFAIQSLKRFASSRRHRRTRIVTNSETTTTTRQATNETPTTSTSNEGTKQSLPAALQRAGRRRFDEVSVSSVHGSLEASFATKRRVKGVKRKVRERRL
jgi:hypothetical protein